VGVPSRHRPAPKTTATGWYDTFSGEKILGREYRAVINRGNNNTVNPKPIVIFISLTIILKAVLNTRQFYHEHIFGNSIHCLPMVSPSI
jgi:hypothetical protein